MAISEFCGIRLLQVQIFLTAYFSLGVCGNNGGEADAAVII